MDGASGRGGTRKSPERTAILLSVSSFFFFFESFFPYKPRKFQHLTEPWLYQVLTLCSTIAHLLTAPPDPFSFIATHPLHERRGAVSLLLRWGLECCIRDTVSAYLDSTADAESLYARHGFEVAETISMALEGVGGKPVGIEETYFIYQIDTIGVNWENVK